MIDEAWPFWQVEDGNQVAVIRRSSTSSDCPFGLRQITLTVGINPAQLGEGLLAAIAMPLEGRLCSQPSSPVVLALTEGREAGAAQAEQGLGVNAQTGGHRGCCEPQLRAWIRHGKLRGTAKPSKGVCCDREGLPCQGPLRVFRTHSA